MTFPPDADENTPVAWPDPASPVVERDSLQFHPPPPGADIARQDTTTSSIKKSGERRMGWKDFVNISISMAGAQIAWTLELGYGTSGIHSDLVTNV
jgi:solute carrier family 45 protein 1/2/4